MLTARPSTPKLPSGASDPKTRTKTVSFTPQGKGKLVVPGEGVKPYFTQKEAEEAARRAQLGPDPSIELPISQTRAVGACKTGATSSPNLRQTECPSSDEQQATGSEEGDSSILNISIRLGTESTRDSSSQQPPVAPRGVFAHSRLGALRIQQYEKSLQQIVELRNYIDNHPFSGSIASEWELLDWKRIPIVNQRKMLIHAEHSATMALEELHILRKQARELPQTRYTLKSFAGDILAEDVGMLDLNTLSSTLRDPILDYDPKLSHTIVAVAKIYHIIKAKHERLEEELAQWYLLQSWIDDESERLKYEVPEHPAGFDNMYICPRILKEGACLIQEELDTSIKEWTELRQKGVKAGKATEASFVIVKCRKTKRYMLELLPEGYDDFCRFDPEEIRATNLEGEGNTTDLRRQTDLKRFLKSLAIRAKSLHQVRRDLKVLNDLREAQKGISSSEHSRGPSE